MGNFGNNVWLKKEYRISRSGHLSRYGYKAKDICCIRPHPLYPNTSSLVDLVNGKTVTIRNNYLEIIRLLKI